MGRRPRHLLVIVGVATGLAAGCGSEEREVGQLEPKRASIAEVIARPAALKKVRLSGVGIPLDRSGFLLSNGRDSVYVDAPGSESSKVDAGDHLTLTGQADRMSRLERFLAQRALKRDLGRRARALIRAAPPSIGVGVGLVELETMSGEDTHGPQAGV